MSTLSSIEKIKDVLRIQAGSSKIDVASCTRSLYLLLLELLQELKELKGSNVSLNDLSLVIDDIWQSKKISLSSNISSMMLAAVAEALPIIPGFVVRNIVTAAINCCNSKTSTPIARESALSLLAIFIMNRISDCASQSMDVFQVANKLVKATELGVRTQSLKALQSIVLAGDGKLSDMYGEVLKVIQRTITDRSEIIRDSCVQIVKFLAEFSDGFSIIQADILLALLSKPLEDESANVQNSAAIAAATIYELQIRAYVDKQEQAKIGAARGSDNAQVKSKQPATTSRLSLPKFTTKKVVEEQNDLKTVVDNIIRLVQRSNDALRSGYILTLGYLVQNYLYDIDVDDLDWAILQIMAIPQDTSFQQLSFEEQTIWRSKISMTLRSRVFAFMPEPKLISVANALIKSCGGLESGSKSDLEMQLILEETNHILNNLGSALISMRDEAITCATVNLRHGSFAVRVAAANILVTVAAAVPAVAIDFVRNALNNARTQASQLASMDFSGEDLANEEESNANSPNPRRRTAKEMEKLQRMYYFHGHAMVIAMILRNVTRIPDGLNYAEILEALDFGLSMMNNDLYAAPATSKNVLCSIIRAGALIVSSCLSIGFEVSRLRLRQILDTCSKIFHLGETDPQVVKPEELVYEVMCIESAVVCIYNLLQYSAESLALDETCLITVIDNLEVCFRNLKNKYQPIYRSHFRFRTLHVILLESFALLPPGSYPNSCQQIYVEALRVYRDCISLGVECTSPLLENLVRDGPRNTDIQLLIKDRVWNESTISLKLEQHATILQKRETEAFLTLFGQDFQPFFAEETFLYDARKANQSLPVNSQLGDPGFKSSLIETRSMDTAIKLMAVTFSHQSSEYQDKAIQLFAQALAQIAPPATSRMSITGTSKSLSLFGNDEERKRKERKIFLVNKNVVCALHSIVDAFPVHSGEVVDLDYQWRETLIDQLYSFLVVKDDGIRFTAAIGLAKFSMKWRGYNVISSISQKIRGAIIPSLAKTASGDTSQFMEEFSGYIPALGYLWSSASSLPDVRSLVSTTLFDCLRKTDASIHFLSLVMASLSNICESHLLIKSLEISDSASEVHDFLEKIAYVVESTQALASNVDEEDSLAFESVSLLGYALALALHCNLSAELKLRLHRLLTSIYRERNHVIQMDMVWMRCMHVVAMHDVQGEFAGDAVAALQACKEQDKFHLFDSSLDAIVGIVMSLADYNPQTIVQTLTVDYLFELLEISLNRVCAGSVLDQRGVEIRNENIDVYRSSQYRALSQQIESAIQTVIVSDVQKAPTVERYLTYWVLYLRSVALGLGKPNPSTGGNMFSHRRSGGVSGPVGGASGGELGAGGGSANDDNEGEEEGDEAGAGNLASPAVPSHGDSSATPATTTEDMVPLQSITSISQLGTVYREYLLKSCPYLPFGRIEIKTVAIRLATKLIQDHLPSIVGLTDIARARHIALQELQQLKQDSPVCPARVFVRMYMPIALYLNDLVNLGCSVATYTLNDKTVPSLQIHGMQFLAEICRLFVATQDPDYQYQSQGHDDAIDAVESKLLLQFLSQLSGAVRVCLAVRHAPQLMTHTVQVLCLLLSHGFIRDKVALKRLLKPIASYFEDVFPNHTESSSPPRRPITGGVHETIATQEMLIMLQLLAQLQLLSAAAAEGVQQVLRTKMGMMWLLVSVPVDAGIRATLAAFVLEIGDKFVQLSRAVLSDTMRMLLTAAASSDHPPSEGGGPESDAIRDIHPLRGGLTYSSMVHILALQGHYIDTAMWLAMAMSLHPEANHIDLLMLFVTAAFDACFDASSSKDRPRHRSHCLSTETLTSDLKLLISQLCLHRAVLSNSQHSLSLLHKLQSFTHFSVADSATVDIPLVTRIVVTILQQQQPTSPLPMEVLRPCWTSALTLTQTLWPWLFVRSGATPGSKASMDQQPLLSHDAFVTRCLAISEEKETPAASGWNTVSAEWDTVVKEVIVCWLVLASKLLTLTDGDGETASLKEASLAYIARLLGFITMEYALAHSSRQAMETTNGTGVVHHYGALYDTCVKAYAKIVSLVPSATSIVQEENAGFVRILWQGYQILSVRTASPSRNGLWEALLEIASTLWNATVQVQASSSAIPLEMIALVLSSAQAPRDTSLLPATIAAATRLLPLTATTPAASSAPLRQWWIPTLLSTFAQNDLSSIGDDPLRALYLRFFLVAFTTTAASSQTPNNNSSSSSSLLFLQVFLPVLCDSIAKDQQQQQQQSPNAGYLLLAGRALTHIARTAAEEFKTVVGGLSEANRLVLQLAMRTAIVQEQQQQQQQILQQQQQQQQQQQPQGGGIKINMDRYKK